MIISDCADSHFCLQKTRLRRFRTLVSTGNVSMPADADRDNEWNSVPTAAIVSVA